MTVSSPRLMIGLPIFNGAAFIGETLDSLIAQTYVDWELVVSDNASTDNTPDIVTAYAEKDARIRLVRQATNRGASHNYNVLAKSASTELFKWASYDDLYDATFLTACVTALDAAGPDTVLAYTRTTEIDDEGQPTRAIEDRLNLRELEPWERLRHFAARYNLSNAVFGVLRTEVLQQTRLIEPYVSSDVTLLADLAARGRFVEVPDRLFYRRIHATTSRQGNLNRKQTLQFFRPDARIGQLAPRTRMTWETTRALSRALPEGTARWRTQWAFLTTWTARRLRMRAGRIRRRFRASRS